MAVTAIAHSYWRRIKDGARAYETVPLSVKDDVKTLAREDMVGGVITAEQYAAVIGEAYGGAEADTAGEG